MQTAMPPQSCPIVCLFKYTEAHMINPAMAMQGNTNHHATVSIMINNGPVKLDACPLAFIFSTLLQKVNKSTEIKYVNVISLKS